MTEKLDPLPLAEAFNFEPDALVYLEIGYGTDPSALRGSRVFNERRVYVGVDTAAPTNYDHIIRDDSHGNYGDVVRDRVGALTAEARSKHLGEDIRFAIGNGENLPTESGRIAEVYVANVLTSIDSRQRPRLLEEIYRVLQLNGDLVVKTSWDAWLWSLAEIEEWVQHVGFEVASNVDASDEGFTEMEHTYGTSEGIERQIGHFVIAQKPAVEAKAK